MSAVMTPYWLSKNIRSVVALIVVLLVVLIDSLVLFATIKTSDVQLANNIVTSLHGALMFVLGYYYSANHTPQGTVITSEIKSENKPNDQ